MGLRPKPPSHGGYNKFDCSFLSFSSATACCRRLSCQVLDHDVACAVCVPIRLVRAERAAEVLLASQVGVESTTITACLAGVGLVADDHAAVVVGASLLQEVLPEAKVAHGAHGTSCLAADLALHLHQRATGATPAEGDLLDHLLCLELGQQDHAVVVAQPLCVLAMKLPHLVLDPLVLPEECHAHPVALPVVELSLGLHVVHLGLELVHSKDHRLDQVMGCTLSKLVHLPSGIVRGPKGAHPWVDGHHGVLSRSRDVQGRSHAFQRPGNAEVVPSRSRARDGGIVRQAPGKRVRSLASHAAVPKHLADRKFFCSPLVLSFSLGLPFSCRHGHGLLWIPAHRLELQLELRLNLLPPFALSPLLCTVITVCLEKIAQDVFDSQNDLGVCYAPVGSTVPNTFESSSSRRLLSTTTTTTTTTKPADYGLVASVRANLPKLTEAIDNSSKTASCQEITATQCGATPACYNCLTGTDGLKTSSTSECGDSWANNMMLDPEEVAREACIVKAFNDKNPAAMRTVKVTYPCPASSNTCPSSTSTTWSTTTCSCVTDTRKTSQLTLLNEMTPQQCLEHKSIWRTSNCQRTCGNAGGGGGGA